MKIIIFFSTQITQTTRIYTDEDEIFDNERKKSVLNY